jgi:hypothetical protein
MTPKSPTSAMMRIMLLESEGNPERLMETMHRIAMPYFRPSARVVKHYEKERQGHLHSKVQAWWHRGTGAGLVD